MKEGLMKGNMRDIKSKRPRIISAPQKQNIKDDYPIKENASKSVSLYHNPHIGFTVEFNKNASVYRHYGYNLSIRDYPHWRRTNYPICEKNDIVQISMGSYDKIRLIAIFRFKSFK